MNELISKSLDYFHFTSGIFPERFTKRFVPSNNVSLRRREGSKAGTAKLLAIVSQF